MHEKPWWMLHFWWWMLHIIVTQVIFFKIFGRHNSFLWATDTPVLDFWWCLICTWQRHACYVIPEIHLWCNTCWPLGGQHSGQSLPHMCVSVQVGLETSRISVRHANHSATAIGSQIMFLMWDCFWSYDQEVKNCPRTKKCNVCHWKT